MGNGKKSDFSEEIFGVPTFPLMSGRADLSELFAQMLSPLEAVVLGEAAFPKFL